MKNLSSIFFVRLVLLKNSDLINKYQYGYNDVHMKMYEQRVHESNKGDIFAYDAVYRLILSCLALSVICLIFFILIKNNLSAYPQNKNEITQNAEQYEKILLELGAFPYMKEKGKLFYINAKGCLLRRDINGWVSPYQKEDIKLCEAEKTKYNYPPTTETILKWYNKYKWMLSAEEYRKSKNIQYKTIIYFLLEIIIMEELPVENYEELIELAKSKTGYEGMIIRLLKGKINLAQAWDIFSSINKIIEKDVFIMDMLFPSVKGDNSDLVSIQEYINDKDDPIYFRWYFLYELYQMDKEVYRQQFIETSIKDIWHEKDDFKRSIMYEKMLETDEERIKKYAYNFIEREPDTKCRLKILFILTKLEYIDNNILRIIKEISFGKGKYWHFYDHILLRLESFQYQDALRTYLKEIFKEKPGKKMSKKINKIINKLDKIRIRKIEDMEWYFDYFKIKDKSNE